MWKSLIAAIIAAGLVLACGFYIALQTSKEIAKQERTCQNKGHELHLTWHYSSQTGCEVEVKPEVWVLVH